MGGFYAPNIGNALVRGMQMREMVEGRQERQRRRDLAPDVQAAIGGDTGALGRVAAVDPDYALKIGPVLDRLDANKAAVVKRAADFTIQTGMGLLNTPPEMRPQAYQAMRAEAQRLNIPTDTWPAEWGPQAEGFMNFNVGRARDVNKYYEEKAKTEREMLDRPQPIGLPGQGPPAAAPNAAPGDQIDRAGRSIAGIESQGQPNGGYGAVGPETGKGRALGKYQVMSFNVGPWTKEALGTELTPEQFLANPQAQEAVFRHKFGQYQQKYGPDGAARAWFAGEGGMNNPNAADVNGMTVARYGERFNQGMGPQVAQGPQAPVTVNNPAVAQGRSPPVAVANPQVAQGPSQDFATIQSGDARRSGGIVNVQGGSPQQAYTGPQGDMNAPGIAQAQADAANNPQTLLRGVKLPPGARMMGIKGVPVIKDGTVMVQMPDGSLDFVPLPQRKDQTGGGPFSGTGMDQQAYNIVLRGDPMSPEYAAAYAHLAAPKVQLDQQTGQSIQVQPDMSWARPPGGAQQGVTAPSSVPPGTKGVTVTPVPGMPGRMNNEQARDAGFADRMTNSNQILEGVAQQGGSFWGRMKEMAPGNSGNFLQSDQYQSFKQARDDFINAQLRRESGAAISKDEYDKADRQYFPIPGDSEATIQQKAQNRLLAVDAMVRSSGPAYRPGPNVPKVNGPADQGRALFEARDAIRKGADPEKVKARLKEMGVDHPGQL